MRPTRLRAALVTADDVLRLSEPFTVPHPWTPSHLEGCAVCGWALSYTATAAEAYWLLNGGDLGPRARGLVPWVA